MSSFKLATCKRVVVVERNIPFKHPHRSTSCPFRGSFQANISFPSQGRNLTDDIGWHVYLRLASCTLRTFAADQNHSIRFALEYDCPLIGPSGNTMSPPLPAITARPSPFPRSTDPESSDRMSTVCKPSVFKFLWHLGRYLLQLDSNVGHILFKA